MILSVVIYVVCTDESCKYEESYPRIYVDDLTVQVIGQAAKVLRTFVRAVLLILQAVAAVVGEAAQDKRISACVTH